MKILQINSVFGFGSTGRNTEEIANFLEERGYENFVAYAHGTCDYPNCFKYGYWLERKWHAVYFRLFGKQGLLSKFGTKKLIKYIKTLNPDVIHLNSVHGNHLNIPLFFNFLSKNNYPIVWTLHDCWSFTGVCYHYTSDKCYKWKTGCTRDCPHHHPLFPEFGWDRVKDMFELKKKHFTSIDRMIIVPVSKWLESEAKQSFLSKYPIRHIYNWVDTEKFYPVDVDIRGKYNIPAGKKIVLGVAAQWVKSSSKYDDAVKLFEILSEDTCMVMVGSLSSGTSFPEGVIHIPYVNGTDELAKIYSSVMVYVHFSVEDTFGKVVAEAMACGTPVIVFNSTALPELVDDGCGYVVEPHDVAEVNNCIIQIKNSGDKAFQSNCIEKVRQSFDSRKNLQSYLDIYKSII